MKLPVSPDSLLKALYETLPDPVLIINADRIVTAANAAATKLFGYSEQDLTGMHAADFMPARQMPVKWAMLYIL